MSFSITKFVVIVIENETHFHKKVQFVKILRFSKLGIILHLSPGSKWVIIMSHDYSNLEQQHNRGPGAHLSSPLAPPWKMSSKQNSYFHHFKRGLSHTHQARCNSFKFVEQLFLQYKFQKIKVCTGIQDRIFHSFVWTHNYLTLSWMVSILEVYIVHHKIVIKFNEQIRDNNEAMAILRS